MDNLATLRRQLKAGGYSPIPCEGKKPPVDGWEKKITVDDDEINLWSILYQYAGNTGVLTKYTPAFDIDVLNPDAAKAVEDLVRERNEEFGRVLVRFGLSPKRAVLFQTDAPFKKIQVPLIAPNGCNGEKLELLGDGQQLVVDGIHPITKRPYSWHGGSPFEIPRGELPNIRERDAAELIDDAADLLVKEHGYAIERPHTDKANGGNKPDDATDWGGLIIGGIYTGGNLHDSVRDLTADLITAGMSAGAVVNLVRDLMNKSQAPRDERWQERYSDIPRAVAGWVAKRSQTNSSGFRLIPFRDLRPTTARNYLIKGIIPRTGIVVIWGAPKTGKSFWTFDLMLHIALGWPYRDHRVVQGAIVYLAFEGAAGFNDRAEAFRRRHNIDPDTDIPFFLLPSHSKLVRDHVALIDAIRARSVAPVAVVLDTLNRSLDGSESKDEDMSAYLAAAEAIQDAFGCAVVIVHHCGTDASRPRGHTSLSGAADAQLAVSRDDDENITAVVEFMKDGPEGAQFTSRLESIEVGTDDDGDVKTSCVVVQVEGAAKAKGPKLPAAPKLAFEKLRDLVIDAGEPAPASNYVPANVKVVPITLWRDVFYNSYPADKPDAKQKAFVRATLKLQEDHLVGIWSDKAWIARAS
jgi:hypothetical protein